MATAAGGIPASGRRARGAWLHRAWLALADVALLNAAFVVAYIMRYNWLWFAEVGYPAEFEEYLPIQVAFTLVFVIMFRLDGVYDARRANDWFDQAYGILNASVKAFIIVLALVFFYRPLVYSRLMMAEASALAVTATAILRLLIDTIETRLRQRGVGVASVLIVGAGEIGRAVMRVIVARPDLGLRCIGFVDDDPGRGTTTIGRFPALGSCAAVPDILRTQRVDEMVITLPWSAQSKIAWLVGLCERNGVLARVAPSLLQLNLVRLDVADYGGIPLLTAGRSAISTTDQVVKRVFDIVMSLAILALTSPVIALCALLIALESPGSPVFSHTRIGQNGRPFRMYKLRSMRRDAEQAKDDLLRQNEADGPLFKMKNDPRMTRIGKFIRRTSIDELLQFWNVLRGEMSVVGPRPHIPPEVANYAEWHRPRLSVRPGITGLPQISGRSELAFDEAVMLDLYYIDNWSPSLDLRIMLKTPFYLLMARGAY